MSSESPAPEEIFLCRQCGDCCKGYGGTFVTRQDIERMAQFLQITPDYFISTYCSRSGKKFLVSQGDNGYCIFWDQKCTIHEVKPKMCRMWPYIHSVLIDAKNWQIMGAVCPGMRTEVPDEVVRACVRKVLGSEAKDYPV